MKSVGRTLFELSHYNEVWTDGRTDGQTDRQTDGRTDKVITIGLPHLRWRGPNYDKTTSDFEYFDITEWHIYRMGEEAIFAVVFNAVEIFPNSDITGV